MLHQKTVIIINQVSFSSAFISSSPVLVYTGRDPSAGGERWEQLSLLDDDGRKAPGRARRQRYLRDTVCCTEFERPTLEGVFLKTLVSRWARSFRLWREENSINESCIAGSKKPLATFCIT